jgi:hypothetical protein
MTLSLYVALGFLFVLAARNPSAYRTRLLGFSRVDSPIEVKFVRRHSLAAPLRPPAVAGSP